MSSSYAEDLDFCIDQAHLDIVGITLATLVKNMTLTAQKHSQPIPDGCIVLRSFVYDLMEAFPEKFNGNFKEIRALMQ